MHGPGLLYLDFDFWCADRCLFGLVRDFPVPVHSRLLVHQRQVNLPGRPVASQKCRARYTRPDIVDKRLTGCTITGRFQDVEPVKV